jgi:hypothetical protein
MLTTMQMLRLVVPALILGSAASYGLYRMATQDENLDTPIASGPALLRFAPFTESAANHLATSPRDSRNASHTSPSGETAGAISVMDDRLSVHADKLSLGSVLEEISAKGEISINSVGEIESVAVSANFDALPLTDGLLRLLAKFDVYFLFSAPREEASQLKVVWVYPRGQGGMLVPAQFSAARSISLATEQVSSQKDAAQISDDGTADREASTDELIQALQDGDPTVRYRALAKSFDQQLILPPYILQQMVSAEADADVRALALVALAQNPATDTALLRSTASAASRDWDPKVRERGKELLHQLEGAARPTEGTNPPLQQ